MDANWIILVRDASIVVKVVLLILAIFSIFSWAIIIFKLLEYRRARKNSLKFLDYFKRIRSLTEINKLSQQKGNNPLGKIFKYGFREISMQRNPNVSTEKINVNSLHRALVRASNGEITRFERLNGFLATTGAVTPFIGLFGTVWGIMSSFQSIGIQQNANLATVAPGIAEALIATALGLFAAIPAVIFYNLLLNKLKVIITIMEDFILSFLNQVEKIH
jgi:biopolymer transport protein TolQ